MKYQQNTILATVKHTKMHSNPGESIRTGALTDFDGPSLVTSSWDLPLLANQLQLSDIEEIFGLKLGVDKKFRSPKEKHLLDIPRDLSKSSIPLFLTLLTHMPVRQLERVPWVLGENSKSASTCEFRLSPLLIDIVSAEQDIAKIGSNIAEPSENKPVSLSGQSSLSMRVQFEGITRTFCAKSDYSVWCDNDGNDDKSMTIQLVVVKSTGDNQGHAGLCQCLGYMGESAYAS